jgi:hypothetical protein
MYSKVLGNGDLFGALSFLRPGRICDPASNGCEAFVDSKKLL